MSEKLFESLASPENTNEFIENVLLITLNPENPRKLYLMNDDTGTRLWTLESIEMNLFERVMSLSFEGGEDNKVISYLYNSFLRLKNEVRNNNTTQVSDTLTSLIFRNMAISLKEPDLFPEQSISEQLLDIFKESDLDNSSHRDEFLSFAVKKALEDADDSMKSNVKETFFKCFDACLKSVRQASMITLDKWILTFLAAFTKDKANPELANLFLDYITLPSEADGVKYADTLLGKDSWSSYELCAETLYFTFRSTDVLIDDSKEQPRSLRVLRQPSQHQLESPQQLV